MYDNITYPTVYKQTKNASNQINDARKKLGSLKEVSKIIKELEKEEKIKISA